MSADTTSDPTTISDSVAKQRKENVLIAPAEDIQAAPLASTVTIALCNTTTSSNVYAYIIGLSLNDNGAVCLLQSDGSTLYLPANPPKIQSPLRADCAIALGGPGTTRNVTIPYIAGGRVFFIVDGKLTFLLNPSDQGAALVEPSVSNPSDPNYDLNWGFCEFTFNTNEIYANISFVDFVSLPIALSLTGRNGTRKVGGIPANGLTTAAQGLIAQNAKDGAGWDQLVVNNSRGKLLRCLSPLNGIVKNPALFANYYTDYINQVWNKYITDDLIINMQTTAWSTDGTTTTITGFTSNDRTRIVFPTLGQGFTKPSARDIFAADSGSFAAQATNTAQMLNIGARIDAAFNRSTLLINSRQPDGENISTFYQNPVTNHYGRIVHATAIEGRGYTFPYDDVSGGGVDQSGFVSDPDPRVLLVTVGGGAAPSNARRNVTESEPFMMKRSISWAEDVKSPPPQPQEEHDLEKGKHPKLLNELSYEDTSVQSFRLHPILNRIFGRYLRQFQNTSFYAMRMQPVLALISNLLVSFLSLSLRAILSRVFLLAFVVILYFLGIGPRSSLGELESQKRILEASGLMNGTLIVQGSASGIGALS